HRLVGLDFAALQAVDFADLDQVLAERETVLVAQLGLDLDHAGDVFARHREPAERLGPAAGADEAGQLDPEALVVLLLEGAQPPHLAAADVKGLALADPEGDEEGLLLA